MPPNSIGPTGLTTKSVPEVIAELETGFRTIYGADINLAQNSPDGQLINILALATGDLLDLVAQVYNSFDPDKAIGVALNARCAINGISRRAGTKTVQSVSIVVDRALTLQGLDIYPTEPFTVADSTGNQYLLITTQNPGAAGTVVADFEAKLLGAVQSAANTITTPITIQLGVVSVNNPTGFTTLGVVEETDYAFRIRRQLSVALPNKGYLDGLLSALVDTTGVIEAIVYENNSNVTDGLGIPSHSIWCIINGGTNAAVAQSIYVKRNAGCGMKGSISVNVLQPDASLMAIRFDRPTTQNLWISFNVVAITGLIDAAYIRQQILAQLIYKIGQSADTTTITALVKAISPNASVSVQGVSADNITYVSLLAPTGVNYQWAILSSRIIINGVAGP